MHPNITYQQTLKIVAYFFMSLICAAAAGAQTGREPAVTPLPAPPRSSLIGDIAQTLQEQIKELTSQGELQRHRLAKAQEESQTLAVAVGTHKTALTLDKISVEQARELHKYYDRVLEQKSKTMADLNQEMEKFAKIQGELMEVSKKSDLEKAAQPGAKTAKQLALEQQRRQYQTLAGTAITKLEEVQKTLQAHLDLLAQEKEVLSEFSQNLLNFAEERSRQQLLERQKPTDILTLIQELFNTGLELPQRLLKLGQDSIHSGSAARLLQTHYRALLGLLIFLVLLLYSMHRLRQASRNFRKNLVARAQTFSLKLVMAVINALAHNYYLLAIIAWLALTLRTLQVLTHPAAQTILGGLLLATGISLLKHLLWAMFVPGEPDQGILRLPHPTAHFYYRYGLLTGAFLLIGYYLLWCLHLVGLEGSGYNFAVLIYMLVAIFGFVWLLRQPHLETLLLGDKQAPRRWSGSIRTLRLLVLLGLSLIIIIDLLGFQNLAIYLAGGFFLSMGVLAAGWLLKHMGNDLNTYLTTSHGFLATTLKWEAKTLEGIRLFLTHTLTIFVALLMTAGILASWGIDLRGIKKIMAALSQGPSIGPVSLSPLAIFLAVASLWFTRKISQFSRLVLESGIFRQQQWDLGIQHTIANTLHYALMTVGILVALGFLGINFANLAIIVGGLGVGIGFGLQNIVNNFISGLILLFERPIKVGDLLIIDGQWGTVKAIRVRSTVFETAERSVLVIPNSDLLSNKILNWTFYGRGPNRLALKVSVSYGSDVHRVTRILDQVCRQNHRVLPEPPPQVFFSAYGDSSLDFTVWVFLRSPADRVPATHELHSTIFDIFGEKGIEFPYPQMDIHLRTLPPQAAPIISVAPVIVPADPSEQ